MQLAKREWRLGRWRGLLSAIALGAVLGVLGPFGSQTTLSTGVKYTFWMGLALAGFGAVAATARVLPVPAPNANRMLRIAGLAAASAVPMTFVVAWAMGVVRPGRSFGALQLLGLFPFVALVQLLIARVVMVDERAAAAPVADQAPGAPEYPSELMAKLPPALRRDILALEAEDHYLRVHTLHGSALILMRLADAAAMIDPRLGLRVHRSWWVARNGVRALERAGGRTIVRLTDDRVVPISRSYLPAARKELAEEPSQPQG